jgi:hypothetical protein
MGAQVANLVFARLVVDPTLWLVDREDPDKTFAEAELNLSGIVDLKQAIAIGHLTGARLIVTGSVFQIDNTIHVVAKIIGTETSRVLGTSSKGFVGDGVDSLATRLGTEVIRTIKARAGSLVARRIDQADRVAALKKTLGDARRPTVCISIEENHVGRVIMDPAAETELMLYCTETGFTVIDPEQGGLRQADYLIQGEGMSEFATRHGTLISV